MAPEQYGLVPPIDKPAIPHSNEMMRFVGNDEIGQKEEEARRRTEAERAQNQPVITHLAGLIKKVWEANKDAKYEIEDRLLAAMRQRKGEYDPTMEAQINEEGTSDLFVLLTNIKCRATEAWLKDIILMPGEKPFGFESSPIPTLPPEIEEEIERRIMEQFQQALMTFERAQVLSADEMQDKVKTIKDEFLKKIQEEAKKDAEHLATEIDDDLVEGGWYEAIDDVIYDIVTFPTGFMKGPVVRKKKVIDWVMDPQTGTSKPEVVDKLIREYKRTSPFDMYPARGAKTLNQGDLIERGRFTRKDLLEMIGVKGFDENSIRMILELFPEGHREWLTNDTERAELEDRPLEQRGKDGFFDCKEFWGSVQGAKLREWGMTEDDIPDLRMEYDIQAYMIKNIVFMARLNPHPLNHRPYWAASIEKVNDSIWGKGIPELMEDLQKICNACARAMVNNLGLASGPQIWMYVDKMSPGQDVESIYPFKVWKFDSEEIDAGGRQRDPIGFFQPNSNIDALLKVYDYFYKQASEVTGVPAYIYGNPETKGAAATASGLSMLMNAAAKGLKNVVKNIDAGIIKPSVKEHWLHRMLYDPPENMEGDINVVARASEFLMQQEQLQIRRSEFLEKTNNQTDMQIIGMDGRAEVLRENLRSLKMDVNKIIPEQDFIENGLEEAKMQIMFQNIAAALNIPPELVAQIASGQMNPEGQQANTMAPGQAGPGGQQMGQQGAMMQ